MARWYREEEFPGSLGEFHESEWPQIPGECLKCYACHGEGYSRPCVPRPGEFCGQLCYESLADRPEVLAWRKQADAYERYRQARLAWMGEDHPDYLTEYLDSFSEERRIKVRRDLEETGEIHQFTAEGGRGITTGVPAPTAPRGPMRGEADPGDR